jgi:hypothetical protein
VEHGHPNDVGHEFEDLAFFKAYTSAVRERLPLQSFQRNMRHHYDLSSLGQVAREAQP